MYAYTSVLWYLLLAGGWGGTYLSSICALLPFVRYSLSMYMCVCIFPKRSNRLPFSSRGKLVQQDLPETEILRIFRRHLGTFVSLATLERAGGPV